MGGGDGVKVCVVAWFREYHLHRAIQPGFLVAMRFIVARPMCSGLPEMEARCEVVKDILMAVFEGGRAWWRIVGRKTTGARVSKGIPCNHEARGLLHEFLFEQS